MTPEMAKQWFETIRGFLPARDSRWWSLSFYGGLVTMFATEMSDFVPDQYERPLVRLGVFLTVLGGKMGWSLAATPNSTEGPRPFNKPRAEHDDNLDAVAKSQQP